MCLRSIQIRKDKISQVENYPFHIPWVRDTDSIEITSNVTFFVGENGTGKSTLLEAIAYQCGFHTAGGDKNNFYDLLEEEPALGEYIRLSWLPKITNGFFFRAESFYNFSSYVDHTGGYGSFGETPLLQMSHGESFFSVFLNRFSSKGMYLLDEPEAALSPTRQLAFLRIINYLVKEKQSQFIIATHSPIILGYPNAQILSFDHSCISSVTYEETDHYTVTKSFLENRERFLQGMFED